MQESLSRNCWPGMTRPHATGRPTSTPTRICLNLPCGIGAATNVQEFVRHIWGAELRWGERLAGLPEITKEQFRRGRSMRSSLCTPGHADFPGLACRG